MRRLEIAEIKRAEGQRKIYIPLLGNGPQFWRIPNPTPLSNVIIHLVEQASDEATQSQPTLPGL